MQRIQMIVKKIFGTPINNTVQIVTTNANFELNKKHEYSRFNPLKTQLYDTIYTLSSSYICSKRYKNRNIKDFKKSLSNKAIYQMFVFFY